MPSQLSPVTRSHAIFSQKKWKLNTHQQCSTQPAASQVPSEMLVSLSIEGLEKEEQEALNRKRSACSLRVSKSNTVTPSADSLASFTSPKKDVTLCKYCVSPIAPSLPQKVLKTSKVCQKLSFDDSGQETLRDAPRSSAFDIIKFSPALQKYFVDNSPPLVGGITPPKISPENDKLGSNVSHLSGELEISGCTPPSATSTPGRKRTAHVYRNLFLSPRRTSARLATKAASSTNCDRLLVAPPKPIETAQVVNHDIISRLSQTGNYKIFSYLTGDDLCAVSCVSNVWSRSVREDFPAFTRRREFLRVKRIWLNSPDIENSRMLRGYLRSPSTLRPRTTEELRDYMEKARLSVPSSAQNTSRRSGITPLHISNLRSPLRGANTHPRALPSNEARFWEFHNLSLMESEITRSAVEVALIFGKREFSPPQEILTCEVFFSSQVRFKNPLVDYGCPWCSSPARIPRAGIMATCTKSSCGHTFCPHCLTESPTKCCRTRSVSEEGSLRSWGSAPSIGSRSSKRNLRRLMDK
ncbi:unnamed protein product [Notodromas monacha]|uniref:RING-type domain-containing protein n=1 Tax=Notodromas monacha TaxID=399045 RepID=A0A7R9BU32_9CRUS|nr:unnamed protein product [Notodromas monacha]CAG0920145.1 unnamed protein product [Notodromas monacha]